MSLLISNLGNRGRGTVYCMCYVGNEIYYGTLDGYVIRHSDGNEVNVSVNGIWTIHYSNTGRLWVTSGWHETFYSDDFINWNPYGAFAGNKHFLTTFTIGITNYIIQIGEDGIFSSLVLKQAGVFFSGWKVSDTILYAGESNGHVWKSVDSGENWVDLGLQTTGGLAIISMICTHGGRFIWTDGDSIYYSDDDFVSFNSQIVNGLGYNIALCLAEYIEDQTILAGCENAGIYQSNDNGMTWSAGGTFPGHIFGDEIRCLLKIL